MGIDNIAWGDRAAGKKNMEVKDGALGEPTIYKEDRSDSKAEKNWPGAC